MPSSDKVLLRQQIRKLLDPQGRFVDMTAQLRVWRRIDDKPKPAELLPRIYGGVYDRLRGVYTEEPGKAVEISCHAGQVPLLTFDEPGVARVLSLGAPGGGKTEAAVRRGLLESLIRPNSTGCLVAPVSERRKIVWRSFLELAEPLGWVQEARTSKKEILLKNNTLVYVLAAKSPGAQYGSPLAGFSFDWVVADESAFLSEESQTELDTRGRRAGTAFRIYETATNVQVPSFRVRLEKYKASPVCRIIRYSGFDNPWVEPEYWERLRSLLTDREYREKILAEDVPPEMLVYPRFLFNEHVRPRPELAKDITPDVTFERYGARYKYVCAQDFGVLVNASIILKCYQGQGYGERLWWAIDEITSYQGTTSDQHARRILERYSAEDVLVVADPHYNSKESDKSDFHLFRNEGLNIVPAVHGKISRKHRISMVNALLEDTDGRRRVFIDCDANRNPRCKKLVESFMSLQYDEHGQAEADRKNYRDMTHWSCALGYGVFPWERIRGQTLTPEQLDAETVSPRMLKRMRPAYGPSRDIR